MTLLKLIVACTSISLYIHSSFGQSHAFFRAFDHKQQHNGAWSIVEGAPGNFITSGISYGGFNDMHYYSIDYKGDTLWGKSFNLSGSSKEEGKQLLITSGAIYAIGTLHDSIHLPQGFLFLKMSHSGGLIMYKVVDAGHNAYGRSAVMAHNFIYSMGYHYDSTNTNTDIVLLKTDTNGNKKWNRAYDYGEYEFPLSIAKTNDNGFLIGGEWINPATQNWDLFLLKLDSAGNAQWHKSYGNNTNKERYGYATTTLDGGYAIAGYRETNGQPDGLLIKTDSNGVFQWEKLYGKPQQIDLFKILRQDAKGNFILAGNSRDPNAPNTPRAWLMKTNSNGDTLWTRLYSYYGGDSHTYVEDMIQTSDGGYALTGYTIANVPTGNDLWVLKTDSLGRTCDSPPCHGVITGFRTPAAVQTNSIRIYPNPSDGTLTVDFPAPVPDGTSLVFYNLQGVAVRELTLIPGHTNQAVRLDLPPGLYLYRTHSDTGPVYSGKVVVK